MNYRSDISTYSDIDNKIVNVVVEIPKGTNVKYEINETDGQTLTVVRTLHKGLFRKYIYPFNYGYIANTNAADGDNLDAVVISDEALAPLTVIPCKVVGVIRTVDEGEQDDKILVVPIYSKKKSVNIKKILKFLKSYKYPDQKTTQIGDVLDRDAAIQIIDECRSYLRERHH